MLLAAWPLWQLVWPRQTLDWQPALAAAQPWRWFTAAAVHYSALHLAANLAGLALVGALGAAARVPLQAVAAWALAWPLTHLALWIEPALLHYGGLSGVLHAGVAVTAADLLFNGGRRTADPAAAPRDRWIGGAILAVLFVKLALETPWGEPLRRVDGWDIAVAPLAHACGTAAGLLTFWLIRATVRGAADT